MKSHPLILALIATAIGGYLRFANLGKLPLWVDEAYFATAVHRLQAPQEYLPGLLSNVLGVGSELNARLPFAIAGTLTIFAVYRVKPSKWSATAALLVAVCPLFVMYSRMCRPYSMAGLFVVLGWKWKWSYYPTILCTPTALIGANAVQLWKEKRFTVILIAATLAMLLIRTDLSRPGFFTPEMFINSPRLWYVPALALVMYSVVYLAKRMEKGRWMIVLASVLFVVQSLAITRLVQGPFQSWYCQPTFFNDWRGMRPVDLSTNFTSISEYYTGRPSVLLRRVSELTPDRTALVDEPKIDSIMNTKDTIWVGVDSYANNLSNWFFPSGLLDHVRPNLDYGSVFLLRIVRDSGTHAFKASLFYPNGGHR